MAKVDWAEFNFLSERKKQLMRLMAKPAWNKAPLARRQKLMAGLDAVGQALKEMRPLVKLEMAFQRDTEGKRWAPLKRPRRRK